METHRRVSQSCFNERIAAQMSGESVRVNQVDHRAIVAALKARDGQAAEQAMRTHLARACELLPRDEKPDTFEVRP